MVSQFTERSRAAWSLLVILKMLAFNQRENRRSLEIIFDGGGFADLIRGLFLLGLRRFRRCFVSGKWERAKTAKDDP